MAANLRLTIDRAALAMNWRTCARLSGAAAAGAAVKADGYGLGAQTVVDVLAAAGCRDFFVATWTEAAELSMPPGTRLAVLHGVQADELPIALASDAVPVLCTPAQIVAWRDAAPERACDVMLDTGINRLGIGVGDLALLTDLNVDTLHSHLACADTPSSPHNEAQMAALRAAAASVPVRRVALANSAGIRLGADYHFDLTRPGLALYGGGPGMQAVVRLSARVVQVRDVPAGGSVGYGATWTAHRAEPDRGAQPRLCRRLSARAVERRTRRRSRRPLSGRRARVDGPGRRRRHRGGGGGGRLARPRFRPGGDRGRGRRVAI